MKIFFIYFFSFLYSKSSTFFENLFLKKKSTYSSLVQNGFYKDKLKFKNNFDECIEMKLSQNNFFEKLIISEKYIKDLIFKKQFMPFHPGAWFLPPASNAGSRSCCLRGCRILGTCFTESSFIDGLSVNAVYIVGQTKNKNKKKLILFPLFRLAFPPVLPRHLAFPTPTFASCAKTRAWTPRPSVRVVRALRHSSA